MGWWSAYIGIPFAEKGRGDGPLDCWGLVQRVYADQLGISLPGYEEVYETTADRHRIGATIENQQKRWTRVDDPQSFDVVLLAMAGVPMHVGLVTRPGSMLHCTRETGTVQERYDGLRWKHKGRGFFRHE